MLSAGRVLIKPKGEYSPLKTYEMLDYVSYNGSSYIAKKTTTGNLPTDTEYWQLSASGAQSQNVASNFAEVEGSDIASSPHAIDDVFVNKDGKLLKATLAISIGDTIVIDTNCEPTTVEDLISYLSTQVSTLDSSNKKLNGITEIAVQTDLHTLGLGEFYKDKTSFYVTNGPEGVNEVASAIFRLTVESALKDSSTTRLLTLKTPGGKVYTQNYDGSSWGDWENVKAISNPNLLDNPWFTVNQRGANSYAGSTARVYTFDRWYINSYSSDITVTDNNDGTITIANTGSNDNLQFAQLLESDLLISGKAYTLTCDIVAYTGSVRMLFAGNVSPYPAIINKLVNKTGYVSGNGVYDGTSNTYKVAFSLYANSSITMRAIKLELGSVSTLAMDTAPNYATELLKCQRYFVRLDCPNNYYTFNGIIGYISSDTSKAKMGISLPVPLRTNPTINVSDVSKFQIISGGTFKTLSALTSTGLSANTLSFEVGMTGSGAFTANEIAVMIRTTKDEYIDLSADL